MILGVAIAIASYLFFSIAFFGDKLILSNHSNAKLYVFYIGLLNAAVIFLMPFATFDILDSFALLWACLAAFCTIAGLYTMFIALEKFEVSRVMPAIGAAQPIFILILTGIFWGFEAVSTINFLAFMLLLVGSAVISVEKKFTITFHYLVLTMVSSLMFSLVYVFSKLVFLDQSFLQGLILIGLCTFLFVLLLLFDRDLRKQIFSMKLNAQKNNGLLFLCTQGAGGIANLLQSLAISLVPVSYLAIINSLRGVQYVFLFIITLVFSFFFPKILKEDVSEQTIVQKIVAIVLIGLGLAMLLF